MLEAAKEREIGIKTPEWSYRELVDPRGTSRLTASRLGYRQGQLAQLFDLRSDPTERRDLIGSGERSVNVASSFHAVADAFRAAKIDPIAAAIESEEHVEALKALGYLE